MLGGPGMQVSCIEKRANNRQTCDCHCVDSRGLLAGVCVSSRAEVFQVAKLAANAKSG